MSGLCELRASFMQGCKCELPPFFIVSGVKALGKNDHLLSRRAAKALGPANLSRLRFCHAILMVLFTVFKKSRYTKEI